MKYLAILVTAALFSVMGYLIWDQRNQSTELKNELELLRRQQNPEALNQRELEIAKLESQLLAQQQQQQPQQGTSAAPISNATAAPSPSATTPAPNVESLPPLSPPPASTPAPAMSAAPMQDALPPLTPPAAENPSAFTQTPSPTPAAPEPPPLTLRQRQILGAPPVGKITEYQKEYGFVVLNPVQGLQIENNMTFAIRREHNIIGRIKVTAVEEGSVIADIISGSVPAGVTVNVGDDLIQDLP